MLARKCLHRRDQRLLPRRAAAQRLVPSHGCQTPTRAGGDGRAHRYALRLRLCVLAPLFLSHATQTVSELQLMGAGFAADQYMLDPDHAPMSLRPRMFPQSTLSRQATHTIMGAAE